MVPPPQFPIGADRFTFVGKQASNKIPYDLSISETNDLRRAVGCDVFHVFYFEDNRKLSESPMSASFVVRRLCYLWPPPPDGI